MTPEELEALKLWMPKTARYYEKVADYTEMWRESFAKLVPLLERISKEFEEMVEAEDRWENEGGALASYWL